MKEIKKIGANSFLEINKDIGTVRECDQYGQTIPGSELNKILDNVKLDNTETIKPEFNQGVLDRITSTHGNIDISFPPGSLSLKPLKKL